MAALCVADAVLPVASFFALAPVALTTTAAIAARATTRPVEPPQTAASAMLN